MVSSGLSGLKNVQVHRLLLRSNFQVAVEKVENDFFSGFSVVVFDFSLHAHLSREKYGVLNKRINAQYIFTLLT